MKKHIHTIIISSILAIAIVCAVGVVLYELNKTYGDRKIYAEREISELDFYNNTYYYDYFGSLANAKGFQGFYNELDFNVKRFHENGETTSDNILSAINYKKYGLTFDEAFDIYMAYTCDNPLYYWLLTGVKYNDVAIFPKIADIYIDGTVRTKQNAKIYKLLDEYALIGDDKQSSYMIAWVLHDKIINAVDYYYKADGNTPGMEDDEFGWTHSICGVLERTGAVCEGYAEAFSILLNMKGINNIVVSNNSHRWNLVQLDDGKWYWYDLTNNDSSYIDSGGYDYFCVTDDKLSYIHEFADGDFLYSTLPLRSQNEYEGNEIKYGDIFVVNNMEIMVVSYDCVGLLKMNSVGDIVIPESVYINNNTYSVVSISKKAFFCRGNLTSITIPNSVRIIAEKAFWGCWKLEKVMLGNSVTYIGFDAFGTCSSLKSIIIPSSITEIYLSAFYDCTNLEHIYYTGSEKDWAELKIGEFNDYLINATVHYYFEVNSELRKFDTKEVRN